MESYTIYSHFINGFSELLWVILLHNGDKYIV